MKKNFSFLNFKVSGPFFIALLICALLSLGDLLLPANTFTHRIWEALIVHSFHSLLPGPFYPNQKISMEEQGDLAPYTRFAIKKSVHWETDRYGYRKADSPKRDYEIVVVGDSTIIGTGLDQSDMFSEKLQAITKKQIYPFAPYYEMNTYLQSDFYKSTPPKKVIFSMMEWAIPDLAQVPPNQKPPLYSCQNSFCREVGIPLDRISKLSLMRFFTARLKGYIKNRRSQMPFRTVQTSEGIMIFPEGKSAHQEIPVDLVKKIIPVLKKYQSQLKERGIDMIFMPVPNKESLYYRMIPGRRAPLFYITLAEAAREAGIPTLNLLEIYANESVKSQRLLYHLDDSHWNRYGAEIAARGLSQMLEKPKKNPRERPTF